MYKSTCTSVSTTCPVEATTYGYYPNITANTIFLVVFGICFISQIVIGSLKRVYAYSGALAAGCLMEMLGYAGRLIMHGNPWSKVGFQLQIVCLIIAPSFIAGGIYLTIKHAVLYYGPESSRLKPNYYTWVFIGCDILSILLQAGGGGIAASASRDNRALLNTGNHIMVAGIAFQVFTMIACGILTIDFALRLFRERRAKKSQITVTTSFDSKKKARIFNIALGIAYTTVLIRCIYRLPEMVGGWGNELMRNETEFLTLDGLMILLAVVVLTVFHPGYFYPVMRTGFTQEHTQASVSESETYALS